ncbi:MAG TPA: DUF883 C-terminal domain-containing protein [Planctomycetota bacterium]|nr:DUF883 C-terminal domain-containing protein [Planctomycetota bacterium]
MRNHANGAKVSDKAEAFYSASRKAASKEISRAKSYIHENPVKAALIGVGLGFLLATLMRARG